MGRKVGAVQERATALWSGKDYAEVGKMFAGVAKLVLADLPHHWALHDRGYRSLQLAYHRSQVGNVAVQPSVDEVVATAEALPGALGRAPA